MPALPATQPQGNLLPAQLNNIQPKRDLGGAVPGISLGLAGAGGTAALGVSLAKLSPALAPLLSNPITAGIGVLLGGFLAASPYIINKIKQRNINNKITQGQQELQRLGQLNQNDPAIQQQIQQQQQTLQKYANAGQASTGQPQQGGGWDEYWNGRRGFNEQIPLYTPNTEQYREEVVNQLRNNPANFGPVREEEIRRFNQETAPRLAEQYFGSGAGTEFSGAYPEALGRGGANLGRQLAADEQKFNAERESRLMNVAMQPSFTTVKNPREPGFKETFLPELLARAGGSALEYGGNWLKNKFGGGQATPENPEVINAPQPQQAQPVNQNAYQAPADLSQLSRNINTPITPNAFEQLLKNQTEARNSLLGGRTR